MFGAILLALIFAIITLVIDVFLDQNNSPENQLSFSCIIYLVSIMIILIIAAILFNFSDLYYIFICFYIFIMGIFTYTPLYIRRYLQTPYYKDKDWHYLFAFIFFNLSSLIGMFVYLDNQRIIGIEIPAILYFAFVFVPLIPIVICVYFRDRR